MNHYLFQSILTVPFGWMHVVSCCIMVSSCGKTRHWCKRQSCEFQRRIPSSAMVPLSPRNDGGNVQAKDCPNKTLAMQDRKLMTNKCFGYLWIASDRVLYSFDFFCSLALVFWNQDFVNSAMQDQRAKKAGFTSKWTKPALDLAKHSLAMKSSGRGEHCHYHWAEKRTDHKT